MYIPYLANYIYEHPTLLDLKLKGFWLSDRKLLLAHENNN